MTDWSDYLDHEDNLSREDAVWQALPNAVVVETILRWIPTGSSLLDVGCGSGVLLQRYRGHKLGVEKSAKAAALAEIRNPGWIVHLDLRIFFVPSDVVVCKAVLKHFSLEEWPQIFSRVAQMARSRLIFSMNVGEARDAGQGGYHSTYLPREEILAAIDRAGFRLVHEEPFDGVEPLFVCDRAVFL